MIDEAEMILQTDLYTEPAVFSENIFGNPDKTRFTPSRPGKFDGTSF